MPVDKSVAASSKYLLRRALAGPINCRSGPDISKLAQSEPSPAHCATVVGEEPQLGGTEVEAVLQQLLHETVNELTESFN